MKLKYKIILENRVVDGGYGNENEIQKKVAKWRGKGKVCWIARN